ncbi:unnamed protein product [Citrullus colocynthis]|uniref:Uncharacterized protein n=1 Tax=Citrullus colocynthis TaxID=252529 RepID=A0ABP0YGG9_9ROSI
MEKSHPYCSKLVEKQPRGRNEQREHREEGEKDLGISKKKNKPLKILDKQNPFVMDQMEPLVWDPAKGKPPWWTLWENRAPCPKTKEEVDFVWEQSERVA